MFCFEMHAILSFLLLVVMRVFIVFLRTCLIFWLVLNLSAKVLLHLFVVVVVV